MHDAKLGDGVMIMWSEDDNVRGDAEVCSVLQKVLLKDRKSFDTVERSVIKRCITVLIITFFYMEHTFYPNDRDFTLIEKRERVEHAKVPSG